VKHWNEDIPDALIFDAIRDRLEHSALTIKITLGSGPRGIRRLQWAKGWSVRTRATIDPCASKRIELVQLRV
jgi:hypothetical protein